MRAPGWPICLAACAAALPGQAFAHSTILPVTPHEVWQTWDFDWWIVLPLLLIHWLYGRGLRKLWSHAGMGRGIGYLQAASFLAGEVLLVIALISPLDPLGGTLQAAHMTQHTILIAFAPPLLLLGQPGVALAWALGPDWGARFARLRARFRFLAEPFTATALYAAAIWVWHTPVLYDLALRNDAIHWVEHMSFFATGLLFWSVMLRGARWPNGAPGAIAASLATIIHSGFLAALLTFSPVLFYSWYDGRSQLWGLTALEDQQLAGLIMWVPVMPPYLAACLAAAWCLITRSPGLAIQPR